MTVIPTAAELPKIRDKLSFSSIKMSVKFAIFCVMLTMGQSRGLGLKEFFPLSVGVDIIGDIFSNASGPIYFGGS